MNSFEEIQQNAENMPEETINEAKLNEEHREQQDQEKADALKLLESLKKGFENESLSPEDAEKVRDALRVLEPDSQAIIKIHFANLYENENIHNESITKLKNLTYEYEDLSTTDFNSHESKEREWIIPGWLPANRVGLFSGEGEMGKSHLALQLALAVSIQLENKNQEQSSVYFLKKVDNGFKQEKGEYGI